MFVEIFLVLATLLVVWYVRYERKMKYWQKLGVKTAPRKFPLGNNPFFGNETLLGRKNIHDLVTEQYNLAKGERFYGMDMLGNPTLMITDPELIKQVRVSVTLSSGRSPILFS